MWPNDRTEEEQINLPANYPLIDLLFIHFELFEKECFCRLSVREVRAKAGGVMVQTWNDYWKPVTGSAISPHFSPDRYTSVMYPSMYAPATAPQRPVICLGGTRPKSIAGIGKVPKLLSLIGYQH